MFDEKLGQFFKDAGVDAEKDGSTQLGMAWKLKCKTLGEIKRTEFVDGFAALGVDSIDGIKKELQNTKSSLTNKATFREFFRWLFDFIKDEPERKSIETDQAVEMFAIVLPQHFQLTDLYCEFLKQSKVKAISKDNWEQTFDFARDIKADLSNYEDDSGAWPVLLDDFVEYARKKKNIGKDGKPLK